MSNLLEDVKSYWDRTPCNSKRSGFPPWDLAYYRQIRQNKRKVEPHTPDFADFTKWKRKNVLEVGCGIGTDALTFASAGANVTAIDLSGESLALAKVNADLHGLPVTFIQANMENFTIRTPAGGWDLIYSFGAIHHTPSPFRALSHLRFQATPRTELRIMLYHSRSWKMLWTRRTEAMGGCPVAYTFTREEARLLVECAGWRVTSLEVDHIFPYKISEYKKGRYVKVPWFRWMPAGMFRWMERNWGWHILIKAVPAE